MSQIRFLKMHGLGNDFAIFDGRAQDVVLSPDQLKQIADRRFGIGCDQIIVLEQPQNEAADMFMRIYNPDGGEVGACGNATRCVAWQDMQAKGTDGVTIETVAGLLTCSDAGDQGIEVNFGPPRLEWQDIPLAEKCDTQAVPVMGPLGAPVAVNVGNPHAVFFVDDVAAVDLESIGPQVEHHALFPERTNVEVVQVLSRQKLRMRVWERGTGITQACGSGACAAIVAAVLRGVSDREAELVLDGGSLFMRWDTQTNDVYMTGPYELVFEGIYHI